MANGKNFAADARGASASTQERAKVAQSVLSLSDEEIIEQIQSLSQDELRKLAPMLRVLFYLISTYKTGL